MTNQDQLESVQNEYLVLSNKFDSLLRISKIGVWEWDLKKDIVIWSSRMYEIYDIDLITELKYDTVLSRVHPDDKKDYEDKLNKRIRAKDTKPIEYRVVLRDGTIRFVAVNMEVINNEQGEAILIQGTVEDVTKRKKSEIKLQESENQLRAILETEPECVKLLNEKGELVDMNPAGLAMIEADSLDSVKGISLNSIIDQPYKKAFEDLTKKAFNGESSTLSFEITGFKGAKRWLETHSVPFKDTEGKIIYLLGVTRDITEQKKAALAIVNSEEKFAVAFQESHNGLAIINAESRYIDVNKSFEKLIGIKREDILNKTSVESGLLSEIDSATRERVEQKVQKTGRLLNEELNICLNNGIHLHVLYSLEPVTISGSTNWLMSFQDISEIRKAEKAIKESELKYRTMIERVSDAFVALDQNWNYTYVNKLAGEIFGRNPETLIGKHIWTEFPEGIDQPFYKAYYKAIATQEYQALEEYYPPYDKYFENHIYPSIEGLTIYFKDITERKKAEEEQSQLNINLEQKVKERTAELEIANKDLEDVNDLFVGNEIKIMEMKEEITTLKKKLKV